MLIKISTGLPVKSLSEIESPNFVLFDHAEEVEFGPAEVLTEDRELQDFCVFTPPATRVMRFINPHVERDLFALQSADGESPPVIGKDRRYLINEVLFTRKGERYRVVFDGVAYICSDEGKTLEKVYAGGGYSILGQSEAV